MISIVIPIFNEAQTLPILYERLSKASDSWGESFEVILVDDGSTDNSIPIIHRIVQRDPHFKVIEFSRNFGHQAAITAGLEHACGDGVVIMDGDLQDPPEEIHRFIQKWREGYDVVYAVRKNRKESLVKKICYAAFYRILKAVSHIEIPLDSGDFCLMDRKVVNVLVNKMPERNKFLRGLRAYAGFKQTGIEYDRHERALGETKYTLRKLLDLALDGLFSFSLWPLRIAVMSGVLLTIGSIVMGSWSVIEWFVDAHRATPHEVSNFGHGLLASLLLFSSGLVLTCLGVLGEYISRIYQEVIGRPKYIIRNILSLERVEQQPLGKRPASQPKGQIASL